MPTYEYRCVNGHIFTRYQWMTEKDIEECPECGAKCERLIGGYPTLIFKGKGFYCNDYSNKERTIT